MKWKWRGSPCFGCAPVLWLCAAGFLLQRPRGSDVVQGDCQLAGPLCGCFVLGRLGPSCPSVCGIFHGWCHDITSASRAPSILSVCSSSSRRGLHGCHCPQGVSGSRSKQCWPHTLWWFPLEQQQPNGVGRYPFCVRWCTDLHPESAPQPIQFFAMCTRSRLPAV